VDVLLLSREERDKAKELTVVHHVIMLDLDYSIPLQKIKLVAHNTHQAGCFRGLKKIAHAILTKSW
jgi:hypothetical protein